MASCRTKPPILAFQAGPVSVDPPREHSSIVAEPARSVPPNPFAPSLRSLQSAHLLESPCHQSNCQRAGEVVRHFHYATSGACRAQQPTDLPPRGLYDVFQVFPIFSNFSCISVDGVSKS